MGVWNAGVWALALVALVSQPTGAAVIGIDLGAEFMKVALVKPGTPFQIVTNVETKRKTEVMVGFNQEERVYCGTCLNLFSKKPHNVYSGIRRLLGRDLDHPIVQSMIENERLPNELFMNETSGRLTFEHEKGKDNEQFFTVHELVSMILTYAKDITVDYGEGIKVRDCVVTVPSFFVQKERQAVIDAAHMAGLKVLSLIDENTAAAVQYGIDRTFENKTHHVLYYNLGSNSLQVSVVAYGSRTVKEGLSKNVTIGTFEVVGKAFDQNVGGMHFTNKITNHLADMYNEKKIVDEDIKTVPRPFAKLKLDAQKVKTVLSANKQKSSSFPSFYKDKDFSAITKRTEFEELSKDLWALLTPTIDRALESAKLTLDDIDDVEMLGGGVRVPKVQTILKEYFGEKELGVHLNGDEAMALGSAFYAANLSTAFRVRRVGMVDMCPFAIGVRFTDLEKPDDSEKKWTKRATIFKKNNKLDSRKVVAFQHDRDISVTFNYDSKDDLPLGSEAQIAVYNVSGIAKFAADMAAKNLSVPKVQLTFMLDASSMVRVMKAEATVEEIIPAKEPNTTTTENATAADAADEEEAAATNETDTSDEDDTNSTDTNSTEKNTTVVKPKATKKVHRVQLSIERTDTNLLSDAEMAVSKEKIAMMDRRDKERMEREEAKNNLESYMYESKDKLSTAEEAVATVTTEEQLEAIRTQIEETDEWLYGDGDSLAAVEYQKKKETIAKNVEAIFFRVTQAEERPKAVKRLQSDINKTLVSLPKWEDSKPQITASEREEVLNITQKIQVWLEEKLEQQDKIPSHESPAFTVKELKIKQTPMKALVSRLTKRPKPIAKAKPKAKSTKSNATNTSEDVDAEDGGKEKTEETAEKSEEGEGDEKAAEDEGGDEAETKEEL